MGADSNFWTLLYSTAQKIIFGCFQWKMTKIDSVFQCHLIPTNSFFWELFNLTTCNFYKVSLQKMVNYKNYFLFLFCSDRAKLTLSDTQVIPKYTIKPYYFPLITVWAVMYLEKTEKTQKQKRFKWFENADQVV